MANWPKPDKIKLVLFEREHLIASVSVAVVPLMIVLMLATTTTVSAASFRRWSLMVFCVLPLGLIGVVAALLALDLLLRSS